MLRKLNIRIEKKRRILRRKFTNFINIPLLEKYNCKVKPYC